MSLRPQHSRVGDGCRLLGTVLIAVHLFLSAWLVIQFEGQYTEGQPAPTKVKALVAIDKEQTLIDVEMENATSFLLYMAFRDFDEPVDSSQSNSSNSSSNNDEQQPTSESKEDVKWLENGRMLTVFALVFLCISECLVIAGIPFLATVRAALLTGVVACFLIVMPATYVLDLAGGDSDDEDEGENQDTLADETFVAKTEQGAMAHEKTNVEQSMLWTGVRFEMMFSGYDLGLVEPENYTAVRDNIPNENETDALSYVEFQSHLDLKYGKNIPTMFLIPVLWFFFPAKPKPTAILDGQKGEQEE